LWKVAVSAAVAFADGVVAATAVSVPPPMVMNAAAA
jgi:hypothetical protein